MFNLKESIKLDILHKCDTDWSKLPNQNKENIANSLADLILLNVAKYFVGLVKEERI